MEPRNVTFFKSPAELRDWLTAHADVEPELWVGFYRKATGRPSVSWAQVVDQALCFGWIDGLTKRLDGESFTIRLTPRRRGSTWSSINIKRIGELIAEGLVLPAGLRAFEVREASRSVVYSYEQRDASLDAASEARLRAKEKAWQFFQAQPASYRRTAAWWVISAKKKETRSRRLETLIEDSSAGRRIAVLRRPAG
jgi:uncharacterized protein YdeI (YjbR/CyaY-like superfamily)